MGEVQHVARVFKRGGVVRLCVFVKRRVAELVGKLARRVIRLRLDSRAQVRRMFGSAITGEER
jgi:hypothetical protein